MSWRVSCPLIGSSLLPTRHDACTGRLPDEGVELVGRRRLGRDRDVLAGAVVVAGSGDDEAEVLRPGRGAGRGRRSSWSGWSTSMPASPSPAMSSMTDSSTMSPAAGPRVRPDRALRRPRGSSRSRRRSGCRPSARSTGRPCAGRSGTPRGPSRPCRGRPATAPEVRPPERRPGPGRDRRPGRPGGRRRAAVPSSPRSAGPARRAAAPGRPGSPGPPGRTGSPAGAPTTSTAPAVGARRRELRATDEPDTRRDGRAPPRPTPPSCRGR